MPYAPIDPNELMAFHSMLGQSAAPPKPKGNFLTHLLPTIGGTGGAIGGAAAGSLLGPAGTLIGALLGGALGGGGAKVGENAIEHQALGNGVAGQAVEQGILGAGPLRLLKAGTVGVKAGVEAANAGEGLAGALKAVGDRATQPSNFSKNLVTQGEASQGRVLGTSAGQKVNGVELSTKDNARMIQIANKHNIPIGNANNADAAIGNKLDQYGQQIGDHFTNNNTTFTKSQVNQIAKDYISSIKTSDPRVIKEAQVIANDLKNDVTDTKSLWKFRQSLDSRIPDAKQAAGDNILTNQLKAVKAGRTFIAGKLAENGPIPGMKDFSELSKLKPFVSAEARRANNVTGGVIQRIAGSGPLQKMEAQLGKGMAKTGRTLGGSPSEGIIPGLTPKAIATRTVPIGLAKASLHNAMPTTTTAQGQPNDLTSALMGSQDQGQDPLSQTPQSASPYTPENLMADIQRDPKHASDYISTYESLDKIFNPVVKNPNAIKPTSQQFGLAQGGMNALQQLADLIDKNPNVVTQNATPGQGLPLVGSLITNAAGAGAYHPLADSILQSLIHLQTGATATPEEMKAARGQLPQPGDSPQEQQQKLQNLSMMLQPFLQGGTSGADSSSQDIVDALMQAGYGQ